MRRSRRASACWRGSTPSGCRNGGAQRRNFWAPSASCFPARSRADPKVWRFARPIGELGAPASLALAATYIREVGVEVDRILETCSIGSTCRHCTRCTSTTSSLSKPAAGAGGSSSRKHQDGATANGYGAAGRPDERAVLRTHPCAGNGAGAEIWILLEGARTAADGSLVRSEPVRLLELDDGALNAGPACQLARRTAHAIASPRSPESRHREHRSAPERR
jgi:hypothetical protein